VRYSEELGREVCARIAAGASQHQLAREPGMPSRRTFRDWALREPEFARGLTLAKAERRRLMLAKDEARIAAQPWRRLVGSRRGARGGSVSTFTAELGEEICRRIAAGESVLSIGADPAMPCAVTIYNWARREPGFREAYAASKAICADVLFDLAHEVALGATEETVRSDRLRVQTFTRQAALLAPQKYGPEAMKPAPGGADRDAEGRPYFNIVLQQYGDPAAGGPQWTDVDGNAIPRPDWVED
jgi:hypothetical protein